MKAKKMVLVVAAVAMATSTVAVVALGNTQYPSWAECEAP
jgi:hypothetical protein